MDWMPQAIREGILTVIFISGPLVLLAASIGLTIGVIQAATQVQEQTLGSAAKILGIFLALIIFGFYIFQYLKNYAEQNISKAFTLVPTLESHPLPPKKLFNSPIKKNGHKNPSPHVKVTPAPKPPAATTAPALGSALSVPDTVNVNRGSQQQTMPPKPAKKPDTNIREQALQAETIEPSPVVERAAPTRPAPAPVVSPAPAVTRAPAPAPVAIAEPEPEPEEPKPSRARSGINRLRNSIKEFKKTQEAR